MRLGVATSEFGDVDRDGDGRVTLDELGTSELRVRGSELSTAAWDRQVELLAAAFAAADGDNDGALTAAEHRTVRQHALSLHLEREVAFIFQRADRHKMRIVRRTAARIGRIGTCGDRGRWPRPVPGR